MENCKDIKECLCCEGANLKTILDLGNQSPANNYNITEQFPLKLNVCLNCSHAQLSHSVNPDILFRNYPFMSGVSKTMRDYYKWFANYMTDNYDFNNVLEIACNDGSQLDEFKKLKVKTYGIDPAENLYNSVIEKGHKVLCDYFPSKNYIFRPYDLIIAHNVLAHNDNPINFLNGCVELMDDDSILCIQTSQANMIKDHQFDTIYHEHISFFNSNSFNMIFNKCNLRVVEYKFLPDIHGGSDLYILKKLKKITLNDYSDFSTNCYDFAKEFKKDVDKLQINKKIIIYGAAAKMINLIRFTGITPDYIIDDTPTKRGKVICGKTIVSLEDVKDINNGVIIPVWNFYREIKELVESKYPNKFQFLKYVPNIELE